MKTLGTSFKINNIIPIHNTKSNQTITNNKTNHPKITVLKYLPTKITVPKNNCSAWSDVTCLPARSFRVPVVPCELLTELHNILVTNWVSLDATQQIIALHLPVSASVVLINAIIYVSLHCWSWIKDFTLKVHVKRFGTVCVLGITP